MTPVTMETWQGLSNICRRSWYIVAHVWKIYDFKIEVLSQGHYDFHILQVVDWFFLFISLQWKPDRGFQILQFCNCLSFKLQVEVLIAINITVLVYVLKYWVRVITIFTFCRLLTDFFCLYTYEFWLSLCKIVRSSVILLLPLML
jgi:hypothetical protein